jgi:hypothetical protein
VVQLVALPIDGASAPQLFHVAPPYAWNAAIAWARAQSAAERNVYFAVATQEPGSTGHRREATAYELAGAFADLDAARRLRLRGFRDPADELAAHVVVLQDSASRTAGLLADVPPSRARQSKVMSAGTLGADGDLFSLPHKPLDALADIEPAVRHGARACSRRSTSPGSQVAGPAATGTAHPKMGLAGDEGLPAVAALRYARRWVV